MTAPRVPNRPARLNRVLLTLAGLLVLLAGAAVLAVGLDGPRPADWPGPETALIPADRGLQFWVVWAVIPVAAVIGLLCVRWLAAQARRRPPVRTWQLAADDADGGTFLGAEVAARALADEVADHPGVHQARAVLLGARREPSLHLTVVVYPGEPVDEVREHVERHALPRLRAALELDELPADLLVRLHDQPRSTAARLRAAQPGRRR